MVRTLLEIMECQVFEDILPIAFHVFSFKTYGFCTVIFHYIKY
jgi:hypothetical protein